MSEIPVKITVVNRTYPLKVNSNELAILSKAEKAIAEIVSDFEKNYAITDKQDLISMSLIKIATELYRMKGEQDTALSDAEEKISGVVDKIDSYLKTTNVL